MWAREKIDDLLLLTTMAHVFLLTLADEMFPYGMIPRNITPPVCTVSSISYVRLLLTVELCIDFATAEVLVKKCSCVNI